MSKKRLLIILGIGVAVVALVIVSDTMLANHRPAITSLEAQPAKVLPGGSCQITCIATDPDGDELIYGWSANGGAISGQGATITWAAPRTLGSYNVTVVVTDGRGGADTFYRIITVRRNHEPIINSLVANPDWTVPAGSLQVTCNAIDPDGDELSYEWSTDGGSISGAGSKVTWTAPQAVGTYNITVVINDGYGALVTRTLPISVALEQPPIIKELRVTKDRYGHCYLKPYPAGYRVGKEQRYDIQCVVADTSAVSYQWSCDDGEIFEISEDGSMISWVAPNTSHEVTITVIVSDTAGKMTAKNVILDVVSCNACHFPGCTG